MCAEVGMKVAGAGVALLLVVGSGLRGQEVDKCSDALAKLPQNVVTLDHSKALHVNLKQWFCSEKFLEELKDESLKLDLTVPIEGAPVPFKFGHDNVASLKKREKFCSSSNYQFSSQEAINTYSRTLPVEVQLKALDVWGQCMGGQYAGGALVKVSLQRLDSTQVSLVAKFDMILDVPTPRVERVVTSRSLKCEGKNLAPGKKIPVGGVSDLCRWDGTEDASAIVYNSLGADAKAVLTAEVDGKDAGKVKLMVRRPEWRVEKRLSQRFGLLKNMWAVNTSIQGAQLQLPPVRWEGGGVALLTVPDGRLEAFGAECVENCDPRTEAGPDCGSVPQNCPSWGARSRWIGLADPQNPRSAGCGVSHWKVVDGASPVWEISADWLRYQPADMSAQVFNVYYNKQLTVAVPKDAVNAELEFELKSGALVRVVAGNAGPSGTGVSLVSSQESGDNYLHTYVVSFVRNGQ